MSRPDRIEGIAIVSADGMIADASGVQPDALKPEADQQFFFATVNRADVLAHGRHSAEADSPPDGRNRIVLTRTVAGVAREGSGNTVLWNPAGASFEQAWDALGLRGGLLAVLGGAEAFGLFLPRYDAFHLTQAPNVRLPGGRTVFPGVPARAPEELLAEHGLKPAEKRTLDASAGLVLATWRR